MPRLNSIGNEDFVGKSGGRRQLEFVFANQREISAGLVEKLLKLKRRLAERFYALYREQF